MSEIKCSRCGETGESWSGCRDPLCPAEYEQEQADQEALRSPDKEQSNTPRVDAIALRLTGKTGLFCDDDSLAQYNDLVREARQLEREVAKAKARQHMSDLNYDALEKARAPSSATTETLRDALNQIIVRADQRTGAQVSDDVVAIAKAALSTVPPPEGTEQLRMKAQNTLDFQHKQKIADIQVLTIDFWRARAVYLAEEILRRSGPERKPSDG